MVLVGPMISGYVRTVAQRLPGSGKQIFRGFFLSRFFFSFLVFGQKEPLFQAGKIETIL